MTKKQLEKLFRFLNGYCQPTLKPITWYCDNKLTGTKFYLKNVLKFDKDKIKKAITYLNNHGGYCDCEVLLNAAK